MIGSNLCVYSDAYILVSGTVTFDGEEEDGAKKLLDEINKGVTFKNYAPVTECISNINNTQIDNSKYIETAKFMAILQRRSK